MYLISAFGFGPIFSRRATSLDMDLTLWRKAPGNPFSPTSARYRVKNVTNTPNLLLYSMNEAASLK